MADDKALFDLLVHLGDNTLILGHRLSEWCGHAPLIEEDIAVANISLDLIGQTQMWLGLAAEIEGEGRSADDLAYLRDAFDFHNLLLLERPNGDFGLTMMRQFLFDAWHKPLLEQLAKCSDERIAAIAEKSLKEVTYHLERSSDLVVRLGDGTEESHRRMQNALDDLWPYAGEMIAADTINGTLAGLVPDADAISVSWTATVNAVLAAATLTKPEDDFAHKGGKSGHHSEHLGFLLAEMQFLQRAYPGATW